MTDIQKMTAIQDASVILRRASQDVSSGTMSVWRILQDAQKHLDANMRGLLYGVAA